MYRFLRRAVVVMGAVLLVMSLVGWAGSLLANRPATEFVAHAGFALALLAVVRES